jgi:hypothetical protein
VCVCVLASVPKQGNILRNEAYEIWTWWEIKHPNWSLFGHHYRGSALGWKGTLSLLTTHIIGEGILNNKYALLWHNHVEH